MHVHATARRVDSKAVLRGGNLDYHASLICHNGPGFPSAKSHAPRPSATHVIMTVEILKMFQVENLAISGRARHSNPAYRQSFYFNWIFFASVSERARPPVDTDSKSEATAAQPQRCVWFGFMVRRSLSEASHPSDYER